MLTLYLSDYFTGSLVNKKTNFSEELNKIQSRKDKQTNLIERRINMAKGRNARKEKKKPKGKKPKKSKSKK